MGGRLDIGALEADVAQSGPTFTVNTTNDIDDGICGDDHCSFREAINAANDFVGEGSDDRIVFDLPGDGPFTIQPTSALPQIQDSVTIDGTTQPGANCEAWPPTLLIELDGSNAGAGADGLTINPGNITIQGLVINRFDGNGINLQEGIGAQITCNFIGTNVNGATALGNGQAGVFSSSGVGNIIGGDAPQARNLISGNEASGIQFEGSQTKGNIIAGNYIGVDVTGQTALANGRSGVDIRRTSDHTIGGTNGISVGGSCTGACNLISGNSLDGIELSQANQIVVQGNFIGTDARGTAALGNNRYGIQVEIADDNTIGGDTPEARNVIAATLTQMGISIQDGSRDNIVQGNYIGTDVSGTEALGNAVGGLEIVLGATSNTIGGVQDNEGNLISGNDGYGIRVFSTTVNLIEGNFIGTEADGVAKLGNQDAGIEIDSASQTTIGSLDAARGNIIAANDGDGIVIHGTTATENKIIGNAISDNVGLGIDLDNDGLTVNDGPGDPDAGPNDLQNFPEIDTAIVVGNTITVAGTLNSASEETYSIEVFANTTCDPSDHGEGEVFVLRDTVTIHSGGSAPFSLSGPLPTRQFITAVAIDSDGNTSEFSNCVEIAAAQPGPNFTVTTNTDDDDGVCELDHCTLREAINASNDNIDSSQIDLSLISGTINLTGPLPNLSTDLEMNGPGAEDLTIGRNPGGVYRIFTVEADTIVAISGATIGSSQLITTTNGGGILNDGGNLTLINTAITHNLADNDGGGIRNIGGTLRLDNSQVINNTSNTNGGGIYISGGTATLMNSTVISNNQAIFTGGGLKVVDGGAALLNGTLIRNNLAVTGSGIDINNSQVTITNSSLISGNRAGINGGGLNNTNGGTVILIDSTIRNNTASAGDGGGIDNRGLVQLTRSTISGNRSNDGRGGGIGNAQPGVVELTNSTVSSNSAPSGGGVYNTGGTVDLAFSTVSNNSAIGGLGGGLNNESGTISSKNTIIANNPLGGDCQGTITSNGFNLDSDGTCNLAGLGDISNTNPILGPLQGNLRPNSETEEFSTETHAVLPTSLAINAGDPAFTPPPEDDQRGAPRLATGRLDMGAYETDEPGQIPAEQAPILRVNQPEDNNDGFCGISHCTLHEAIDFANAMTRTGTISIVIELEGIINLTKPLPPIQRDMAIIGPDPRRLTIQRDPDPSTIAFRIFTVKPAVSAKFFNATVKNGLAISSEPGGSDGGGLKLTAGAVDLVNMHFVGNTAINGGCISNEAGGRVDIIGGRYTGNQGREFGGCIYNRGSLARNVNALSPPGDSLLHISPDQSVFTQSQILSGNTATWGGAIFNDGGIAVITTTTISDNRADISGGGLVNDAGGFMRLVNSTISGNTAVGQAGGGIFNESPVSPDSTLEIVNSTLSNNIAQAVGGGVINVGLLKITNSTLSSNVITMPVGIGGGGVGNLNLDDDTVILTHTIIADHPSGGNCSSVAADAFDSRGFNLSDDASCTFLFTEASDFLPNTDPMLGPLNDYGGAVQTRALLPLSPAIDPLGSLCGILHDQRGIPRGSYGGTDRPASCDVGAFERAVPIIDLSENPIDFGEVAAGYAETIVMTNTGQSMLNITEIKLSGGMAFTLTNGLNARPAGVCPMGGGSLAIQDSCDITVELTAESPGLVMDALIIESNAPDNLVTEVLISANAVKPAVLTITKVVSDTSNRFKDRLFDFSLEGPALPPNGVPFHIKDGQAFSQMIVAPGQVHTVTETLPDDQWILVEAFCTNGDAWTFAQDAPPLITTTLAAGAQVSCTFVNQPPARLIWSTSRARAARSR